MTVRRATSSDSAAIAKVHVDTWRSTYHGIVSEEVLEDLSYDDRHRMWENTLTEHAADNHLYVVEDENGEVVGFVATGMAREAGTSTLGEIYAIYLLKEHQGKGMGKLLFLKAAERLSKEGYESMMLWVLADNPTRGFYEAMGGILGDAKDIDIGGDMLHEVAYRWEKLESLAG